MVNLGFHSVRISGEYERIYNFLLRGSPPRIKSVFPQHTHTFVLMAVVGCMSGNRTELRSPKELLKAQYFSEEETTILTSIALHAKGFSTYPSEVLRNSKEIITLAEQYADYGMQVFCNELFGSPEAFVKLIETESVELQELTADMLKWVLSKSSTAQLKD